MCIIVIAMFCSSPFLQLVSLAGGTAMLCCIKGRGSFKSLLGYALIISLVTISNPLFVHKGITRLFMVGNQAFTLEALLYGLSAGVQIAGVILWFGIFSKLFSQDSFLAVFGKRLPKTALIISMTTGFIPKLRRRYHHISAAQKGVGAKSTGNLRARLMHTSEIFCAVGAYEAENAVDTSISMNARGYGLSEKTKAEKHKLRASDLVIILASSLLSVVVLYYISTEKLEFWFYPRIVSHSFSRVPVICFSLLCAAPFIFEIKERIKWKLCHVKI